MKRPRIKKVEPMAGHLLRITFIGGSVYTLRFAEFFSESIGLVPLKNEGEFMKASIDDWGCTVEWPNLDIQIGAAKQFVTDGLLWR